MVGWWVRAGQGLRYGPSACGCGGVLASVPRLQAWTSEGLVKQHVACLW
jgi:hypothetical protein